MGLSPKKKPAELAPSILFPSRLERWPILAGMNTSLEYRSVKICGKRYPALVDNQASLNMMSLAFVKKIGLVLHPDNTAFRLTDGSICHAVGRVRTRCKLVRPSQAGSKPITHQQFYVLQHTFTPLVLGVPFLQATGLPGLFPPGVPSQTTLAKDLVEAQSFYCMAYSTLCLKVHLSHKSLAYEALAIPDNGANVNLISLDYARAIGFSLDRGSEVLSITLGNGQSVFALGKIYTMIQLHHNTSLGGRIPITFFAIKGLVADLVLSRHFLKKNLLFEECLPHLHWILIERDIPGLLPTGLRSRTLNDNDTAKIPISSGQSKINWNPNRFGQSGTFRTLVIGSEPSSRRSNEPGAQVQHAHLHRHAPTSGVEEPQATRVNADEDVQERPQDPPPHYLASGTPTPVGLERIPVHHISRILDEHSRNSSQDARQISSPGTTSPSDTPSEKKRRLALSFHFKVPFLTHGRRKENPDLNGVSAIW